MNILVQLFEIIQLKRQPQDIDYDVTYACLFVIAVTLLMYIIYDLNGAYSKPFAYSLTQNLSKLGFLYAIFLITNKQNRFVQTCTVLFGINLLAAVILVFALEIKALFLVLLILNLWIFYLTIKIFKAAFDTNFIVAICLALSIDLVSGMVVSTIYPEFSDESQTFIKKLLEN